LKLVPAPPVYFSTALRITFIAISFILIYVVSKIWQKRRRHKVALGIILVLLLLFVLWLIPPIPVWFFTALGIIGLLTSLAFMVAVFWKGLARKLGDFLEGQFQFVYYWLAQRSIKHPHRWIGLSDSILDWICMVSCNYDYYFEGCCRQENVNNYEGERPKVQCDCVTLLTIKASTSGILS
jgi:hypothetical protein